MLNEDELGAGNSLTSLIQSVAVISGPALGALLLVLAAPTWSFVVNAVSFALGAVLTSRISTRSRPDRSQRRDVHPVREFAGELADGARVVREQPVVRVLTSLAVGASFVYGTQTVVLVLVASRIGTSTSAVGVLYAALGFGGVLGAPIASRAAREQRLGGIALAALTVASAPMAALAVVHTTALAVVLVAISGAGMVVVDVLSITLLQRSVANELTGRVMGIFDASNVGAMIVGSIAVGPLIGAFSYDAMLVVVAVTAPLVVIFQVRSLLHADRDAALSWSQTQLVVSDLQRVSLFAPLREGALERVARGIKKERYAVDDTILVEGTIGSACYTVLHGRVDVRRGGEDGDVIATLAENDHFGEIGLLHDVPRTATVTAASDVVLYVIDAETFRAALETDAIVASHAMESAGARLAALTA
jgi:MFS family permease